jgi:CRISPR-associated endonuclease/helicase Cas3
MHCLWAKTDRDDQSGARYHPLICHLLDVAIVARTMWQLVLTPALRSRVADGLGLSESDSERFVQLLAGLHDIGKATPGFQAKNTSLAAHLDAAGLRTGHPDHDPGHGRTGALIISTLLRSRGVSPVVATAIATATGGHHGLFPTSQDFASVRMSRMTAMGGPEWDAARAELMLKLDLTLGVPERLPGDVDHPTCMIIAGLISVADWIGSDSDRFPFQDSSSLTDVSALRAYLATAEKRALDAISALSWNGWTSDIKQQSFEALFGFPARPVQEAVVALPGILDGPGLVVIELPMGEGKTEAAFHLADQWARRGGQRGLYIAMPTMATSNGMFGRLLDHLRRRFDAGQVNVQLIHSHAAISPELEALRGGDTRPPIAPADLADDAGVGGSSAEVVAEEWFTRRKRGLLAPYGVGTVDQGLLAALRVRHVFVRVFGLAGKTVVFDEVHAYDTYMSRLFERLLSWLSAVGASVVILTATLPSTRRETLMRAYADGLNLTLPTTLPREPYPRLSWVSQHGAGTAHVPPQDLSALSRRELKVRWVDMRLPEDASAAFQLAEELRELLQDGGCVAVICNTVSRAQRIYERLKVSLGMDSEEIELLHARFLFEERDMREKRALVRFGKPEGIVVTEDGAQPVVRPARSILVATQIVEQSLDLDFDLIVTDLAPADLIIQRAGRLQRHDRERPHAFQHNPVVWIGLPEDITDEVPQFEAGSEAIYDEHVLLRSWLALRGRERIQFPVDIEDVVEEVYDPDRPCPCVGPALRAYWEQTKMKQQEAEQREESEAKTRWIPKPWESESFLWHMTGDTTREDAPEVHQYFQALTRLTLPSVSVVFLWETDRGPAVDVEGRLSIDIASPPSVAIAKHLLRRAVSVSHRGAVHDLISRDPPSAWRTSSLLRHHRLLTLDAQGCCSTEHFVFELDANLGLLIRRKER